MSSINFIVGQLISITSEKIELVLGGSRPGETGIDLTITHINLSYPDVSHTHIEVSYVFMRVFQPKEQNIHQLQNTLI